MNAPQRIRFARVAAGLTHMEVAEAIGLNLPSYYDLEGVEDEVQSCISLRELQALSRTLRVDPGWIVTGKSQLMGSNIGLASVPALIRSHLEDRGITLADFEEQAGWMVGETLADGAAIWGWNVDCLTDVCHVLGIDWWSVLPPRETPSELSCDAWP